MTMRYFVLFEGGLDLLARIQRVVAELDLKDVEIEWGYRRDGIWVHVWCRDPATCLELKYALELGPLIGLPKKRKR